jgi:signal transduction histidine kinase
MKVEITDLLDLTQEQTALIDMHSVVNIMNVLINEQEKQDYIVNFSIDSVDGTAIHMPPVLQDVMRDLIANARKYTEPGGEISAGLADNGKELRFVVEDTGRGIPSPAA